MEQDPLQGDRCWTVFSELNPILGGAVDAEHGTRTRAGSAMAPGKPTRGKRLR